jgi:hypothetical protein
VSHILGCGVRQAVSGSGHKVFESLWQAPSRDIPLAARWLGHNHVGRTRMSFIMKLDGKPNRPARNGLGGFEQAGTEMSLDPGTEERIGHADFERFAVAAQGQEDTISEPAAEPRFAQPFGHRRAQRGYFLLRPTLFCCF